MLNTFRTGSTKTDWARNVPIVINIIAVVAKIIQEWYNKNNYLKTFKSLDKSQVLSKIKPQGVTMPLLANSSILKAQKSEQLAHEGLQVITWNVQDESKFRKLC